MLLELAQVAKVYGARVIFRKVSLGVAAGSVTLLVGANGAGKSTLMRIMAGLARPTHGEVRWHVPEAALGYLGHATFLYPGLTAWENLAFWRDVHGSAPRGAAPEGRAGADAGRAAPCAASAVASDRDTAIDAVLERVELRPYAHERAGIFSRGMAQRLNLARVLLLEPQLLLLDEPGTGLDARSAGLLRREIALARQRGAGVVWISHDIHGDAALADRVVALEKGHVAYDGPAGDFLAGGAAAPAAPVAPSPQGERPC